jgi:hypothetical protein
MSGCLKNTAHSSLGPFWNQTSTLLMHNRFHHSIHFNWQNVRKIETFSTKHISQLIVHKLHSSIFSSVCVSWMNTCLCSEQWDESEEWRGSQRSQYALKQILIPSAAFDIDTPSSLLLQMAQINKSILTNGLKVMVVGGIVNARSLRKPSVCFFHEIGCLKKILSLYFIWIYFIFLILFGLWRIRSLCLRF